VTDAGRITAVYDYGTFQVVRFEPKSFAQRRADGHGGWRWGRDGIRPTLYRLPELLASTGPVYVVEGEKDVDRLHELGLTATCNVGGAGKWKSSFSEHLRDRVVVVIPDNDAAGREHAREVAESLAGVAAEIHVIELPGLPEKADASDWVNMGHTSLDLERLR
jgi:hypothetical protein